MNARLSPRRHPPMPAPGMASHAPPRRGRPRTHASDAARTLSWYGAIASKERPPCQTRSLQGCTAPMTAAGTRCTGCRQAVQPPQDPPACPRDDRGRHTPVHRPEGWRCRRCHTPVDAPTEAALVLLGGAR